MKKSIAVCPLENEAQLKPIFSAHDLPVMWIHRQRYLCGHIGLKTMKTHTAKPSAP